MLDELISFGLGAAVGSLYVMVDSVRRIRVKLGTRSVDAIAIVVWMVSMVSLYSIAKTLGSEKLRGEGPVWFSLIGIVVVLGIHFYLKSLSLTEKHRE
jgi:hypothetical protein